VAQERDFKGIWIPREVWLSTDLTLIEKLFLVEIDSLDNDQNCYASNAYFADFFGISKGRCTQIIKSLEAKGFIQIQLIRRGKEIKKRVLRVVRKLNTPLSKTKHPYLENAQGNNTSINNTSNKYKQITLPEDDPLLDLYKEFIDHRINLKTPLTQNAFDRFLITVQRCADELTVQPSWVITETIDAGWRSCKPDWLQNRNKKSNSLKIVKTDRLRDVSISEQLSDTTWADGYSQ
jgi:hypothetical protein|tara:strand:+ start:1064 stop:1768 length:705 start_codon:yes stop_codon:yes gene_type:complete